MNKILEKAIDELEQKAISRDVLLWNIYHELKESKLGDENDLQMAREKILKMLKDNSYDLPF